MPAPAAPRALILTADIGGGHVAAGQALAEGLREHGFDVVVEDGLASLGRIAQVVFRDGYRAQLRVAPWTFAAMYRVFTALSPLRLVVGFGLSVTGRRRLARQVARTAPQLVVSTHPALTCVLGRMRRRHRLTVPVVAPITDMADLALWSHPGVDVHLVMHADAAARVERRAGPGSAALAGPLVARRFLLPRDRTAARRGLGLDPAASLVAVSGGGWGLGDLGGAADAARAAGADRVVVLAGASAHARTALQRRFADDPAVEVWGFTDRMDDLLRAADVVVHSTGGVTSLEAVACGCPMIAYGCQLAHIRVHNRAMERLGLLTVADDPASLRTALAQSLAPVQAARPRLAGADPAAVAAAVRTRVRPLPGWRLLAERSVVPALAAASLYVGVCTDEAWSLVARPLRAGPVTRVDARTPAAAVVVQADAGVAEVLARRLAPQQLHLTFAVPGVVPDGLRSAARAAGDDVIGELPTPAPARWLRTRHLLAGHAYLEPAQGLSVGEYVLARSRHAVLVGGQAVPAGSLATASAPVPGDIVVVTAGRQDVAALAAFGARAGSAGVAPVALSALLATSERTDGERSSAHAPSSTAATPTASPAG